MDAAELTVGVEEEYHLVDAETRRLSPGATEVLRHLDDEVFGHELPLSQVETRTSVHQDLTVLRSQLARRRVEAAAAAAAEGLRVICSGTAPLGDWRRQPLTPGDRYARLVETHAQVAEQQMVCGCQIHVGVAERETAVRLIARVRPWLPLLLALSSSSPFWQGRDTGHASWRLTIWNSWVVSGPPPSFGSAAEHDRIVDALLRTGTILDAKQIYWHVRPSRRFPTLEFRIADGCTTLDEVMLQAALTRALVAIAQRDHAAERPPPEVPEPMLRAATWRAARSGIAGTLLDPVRGEPIPARAAMAMLMDHLGPALDDLGDRRQVEPTLDLLLRRGNSAERQRRAVAGHGRLEDAVDLLVEETTAGGALTDGVRPRPPVAPGRAPARSG